MNSCWGASQGEIPYLTYLEFSEALTSKNIIKLASLLDEVQKNDAAKAEREQQRQDRLHRGGGGGGGAGGTDDELQHEDNCEENALLRLNPDVRNVLNNSPPKALRVSQQWTSPQHELHSGKQGTNSLRKNDLQNPKESLEISVDFSKNQRHSSTLEKDQQLSQPRSSILHWRSAAGRTLLHLAAEIGNAASCALLHQRGAKINAEDLHGATPLHLAAAAGNEANVEYLLKAGASSIKRKKDGSTPTHEAAQAGHHVILDLLHSLDSRWFVIDAQDSADRTPLYLAVLRDRILAADWLLRHGANPDKASTKRSGNFGVMYAIHAAAKLESRRMLQLLIDYGVDVNAITSCGRTALHCLARNCVAIKSEIREMTISLLDAGVQITGEENQEITRETSPAHGATPRRGTAKATSDENPPISRIDKRAIYQEEDDDDADDQRKQWSCLHEAAKRGNVEFLRTMRDFGEVDLTASKTANSNWSLLHIAAFYGRVDVVEFLLGRGEVVGGVDSQESSEKGHKNSVVDGELDGDLDGSESASENSFKIADVNVKNDHGRTPLHTACAIENSGNNNNRRYGDDGDDKDNAARICGILIEAGTDLNAVDVFGVTPLHVAIRRSRGDFGVIKLLLENGAETSIRNKMGETPLRIAIAEEKLDVAKVLITSGVIKWQREAYWIHGFQDSLSPIIKTPQALQFNLPQSIRLINLLRDLGIHHLLTSLTNPSCLLTLCLHKIRRQFTPITEKVDQLPLPRTLKEELKIEVKLP